MRRQQAAEKRVALVIGAGDNGLVAAVARSFSPGFFPPSAPLSARSSGPRSCTIAICRGYALQVLPYEGGATFGRECGRLGMFRDQDANRREFPRHSPRDAEANDRKARDEIRHCRVIRPLLMRTPPDPARFHPHDPAELAWLGRRGGRDPDCSGRSADPQHLRAGRPAPNLTTQRSSAPPVSSRARMPSAPSCVMSRKPASTLPSCAPSGGSRRAAPLASSPSRSMPRPRFPPCPTGRRTSAATSTSPI